MVKKCMAILLAIGLMCLGYSQSVQCSVYRKQDMLGKT